MENKFFDTVKAFYFMSVAVLMYYFLNEEINVGVFVTFRHAFAVVLVFSCFVSFLVKPDIARGIVALKSALVYSIPLLVTIVVSLFIWMTVRADTDIIKRGLSGAFVYTNMLSFTLAGAAFLYMFGEKGIWYNLAAILTANIFMIITIIAQNGLAGYMSELVTLVRTFAAETGDIIVQAEIHELAFCLGAYIIYMALKPKKNIASAILSVLTVFCFVSAFKRIGIIAVFAALALGFMLKLIAKFSKRFAFSFATFLTVLIIFILIAYIGIIKHNVFEYLENTGIDTNGRTVIYNAVSKYYTFSPGYIGKGIGFLTYQLSSNMNVGVSAVHNDFLQYFIDLGFWGYILWLISMTLVRVRYFGSEGGCENAIVAFSLLVYLIIASSTDNTMNYPLLTTELAILMIGCGFDEKVHTVETKIFGYEGGKTL